MAVPRFATELVAVIALAGCAADLEAADAGEMMEPVGEMGGPNVVNDDQGGVVVTTVDATHEADWVHLDLANGMQIETADPFANADWDLGFRRFHVKLNGGVSGGAGVETVPLPDAAFDDVTEPPADGWITDLADGDDENEDPDYAFREWFAYNVATHVLTPHPIVYVVRTGDGDHYKVQIEEYYDEAGSAAHVAFRWAAL